MKYATLSFVVMALCGCVSMQATPIRQDTPMRLNQIQVLGTHNSYALGIDPTLIEMAAPRMDAAIAQMMSRVDAARLAEWREYHPNVGPWREGLAYAYPEGLAAQLDAGLRSLEIDVNRDPEGGRFLQPAGSAFLAAHAPGAATLPHDLSDLEQPGLKVLHMADLDFRSSCNLFRTCLAQVKAWSDAHPDHTPIFILLEAKDQAIPLFPNATQILPFDAAAYDELDAEILSIIPRDRIVTPDDVRGDFATLESAVLANNWPTLEASRGKFVFLLLTALDTNGLSGYHAGRPNLEGRVAFLRSEPGQSYAAFLLLDNALVRRDEIAERVRQGYLVRARADIEAYEARINDHTRADAAFASGAQIVSTDFYRPGNAFGTPYVVTLPGGAPSRCNPVNAPEVCHITPDAR